MNKLFIFIVLILFVLIIPVNSYSYIFKVNEPIDLRISCFDENNTPCDVSTDCFITVFRPNSEIMLDNQQMSRSNSYYNYSVSSSSNSITGDHYSVVSCNGTTNAYTTFVYKITPSGEEVSEGTSNIYIWGLVFFILLIGGLLFVTFNIRNPFGKATLIGFMYLLLTATLFMGWQVADNFLTITSGVSEILFIFWRIFMWGTFPFLIGLFIWSLFQFKQLKLFQSMIDKGMPEYEARGRVKKKRW